jgi:hypothetical protein
VSIDKLYKQRSGFTQVPNALICEPSLSSKAKAVYCYLYSRPDDWNFYVQEIEKNFKEGRDAINSAISELQTFGWVVREQVRIGGKFSHNEFMINVIPTVNVFSVNGESVNGKTVNGESATNNTDNNNTDKTNTNKKAKAYPLVDFYALEDSAITDAGKELLCKYVDYRKKVKSSLKTIAPLKAFLTVMREAVKQGFHPDAIFELMESKEWLTVKIEWIVKELTPTKQTPSNMTYEEKIAFCKEELPNGGYIDWFGDVRDSMGYTK